MPSVQPQTIATGWWPSALSPFMSERYAVSIPPKFQPPTKKRNFMLPFLPARGAGSGTIIRDGRVMGRIENVAP